VALSLLSASLSIRHSGGSDSKVWEDDMLKLAKHLSMALTLAFTFALVALGPSSAQAQAKPLKNLPVFGTAGTSAFTGNLSITELTLGNGGLLATGKVTGFLNRQRISQSFTGIPVALFAEGANASSSAEHITPQQLSPDEPFVCDILFLDLAPLSLNLLGLQLDLAEVVLDLDALSGPGNLVGNLLCAVTGLLDAVDLGVLFSGIIESLLDAINGLL
jgi:hypothetical protein